MSKPSDKKPKGFLQNAYNLFAKVVYKCDDIQQQLSENLTDPPDSPPPKWLPHPLPPVLDVVIPVLEIAFVLVPKIVLEGAESLALAVAVRPVSVALREATKGIAKVVKRPVQEYKRPGW